MNPKKTFDTEAQVILTKGIDKLIAEMGIVYKIHVGDIVATLETMKLEMAIRHWMQIVSNMQQEAFDEADHYLHR